MSLPPAGISAHQAFWAKRTGRYVLHTTLVQEKLVAFFAGRGESIGELPVDVDVNDVEAWAQEWVVRAKDAGIKAESDRNSVVALLKARSTLGAGGGVHTDQAQRIVDVLASAGTTLPTSAYSAVSKELSKGRKEEARVECASQEAIFLIYFGILPSAADETWFQGHMSRLAASSAGGGSDSDADVPQINLRLCPSAIKVFAKEGSTPTLERVLTKGGEAFWDYVDYVIRQLQAAQLPGAAQRFREVVDYPVRKHKFSEKMQREYLQRYFFSDYLGRGLPKTVAKTSLAIVAATRFAGGGLAGGAPRGGPASSTPEMLPTPGSLGVIGNPAELALGQLAALLQSVGGVQQQGSSMGGGEPAQPPGQQPGGQASPYMVVGTAGKWEYCYFCKRSHVMAGCGCNLFLQQRATFLKDRDAKEAAAAAAKKGP